MYSLGSYPQLLPLVGATDDGDVVAFSQGELAQAEFVLKHGTHARYDELINGLSAQIDALRDKDSLYSKLGLFGKSQIMDELDEVVLEQDLAHLVKSKTIELSVAADYALSPLEFNRLVNK